MLAPGGTSWTTIPFPTTLNPNQYSCIAAPALTAVGNKTVDMLWADKCNTALFTSQWNSSTWSTPQILGNTRQLDFDDYAISSDANGTIYITYLAETQRVAQVLVAKYDAKIRLKREDATDK
jgi:hypothetical protein